jgi:hypothetical protein
MCHEGQRRIATERARDKHDEVIVQEKVDGSNVGVARIGGELHALGRSGYLAESSRYKQHQVFAVWVRNNADRFLAVLKDGERLCGEWLMQAHGTRYCVALDTPILFGDLIWRPAGEVKVGSQLLGFDEEVVPGHQCRCWHPATVIDARRIFQPCYRIYLADGIELVSSAEHLWLTKASSMVNWTRTELLRGSRDLTTHKTPHHYPSHICRLMDVWPTDRSWEAGYVAGVFDGEGSLSQVDRKRRKVDDAMSLLVGFSQKRNVVSRRVMEILRAKGIVCTEHSKPCGTNNDVYHYQINGGVVGMLKFLGQNRPARLLKRLDLAVLGRMRARDYVQVEHIEFLGDCEVAAFSTTSGTFIANGFGSHNCLFHEPFVAFDLMVGHVRATYDEFMARIAAGGFTTPALIHRGSPLSVENAMERLGLHGFHGAVDPAEGVVWRVERDEIAERGRSERCRVVSFLVKCVRLDKIDGIYLPELSGLPPVYNWTPNGCALEMDEPPIVLPQS